MRFNRESLEQKLSMLSHEQRVAFAAGCAERLLPYYIQFVEEAGWGDPAPLQQSLKTLWSFAKGEAPNADIDGIITEIEAVQPHEDDFDLDSVQWAIDASAAVMHSIDCMANQSVHDAAASASLVNDTIDGFIQLRDDLDFEEDPDFQEKIDRDPLIIRELRAQDEMLDVLRASSTPVTDDVIAKLRSYPGALEK